MPTCPTPIGPLTHGAFMSTTPTTLGPLPLGNYLPITLAIAPTFEVPPDNGLLDGPHPFKVEYCPLPPHKCCLDGLVFQTQDQC
jgi:hypothetical protein